MTKIKFVRREGEISLLRRIKFYPQRSTQTRREMKFKDHASYTRMPMYTARSFNKPDSGLGLKFKYADRKLARERNLSKLSLSGCSLRRIFAAARFEILSQF
ncbi:MAG: hypothetical protein ACFNVQ_07230 [Campylobacter sp.]|jgi:hypothetical protein|uniref:hypothetical protein n=2 Tax=uncultured Campylobacter sp. TaxID=218934 RepID=UPI00261E1277|nr:hypothetical protein [uncultured Campylobacter sp.]